MVQRPSFFFPLRILGLAMWASFLVKNTGVQCHFLQTCPHYALSCLQWDWKKLVHLFQLWIPSWWSKIILVSHLNRTALKILCAFLEVKREVGMGRVWPSTLLCFSTY